MPASKKTGKSKTPSTYTYTACWTCRRRHIKCDLAKPACQRCLKAGFNCEGYDFRFNGADSSRSFRRPVATGGKSQQIEALSNTEVSKILDDLDAATTSTERGPFTVLALQTNDDVIAASDNTCGNVVLRPKPDVAPPSPQDSGYVSPGSQTQEQFNESAPIDGESSPMIVKEPHLLSLPPLQAQLFEHWVSFLSNNMSPFAMALANPFRYVYPALALEGLLVTPEMAAPRLAVLHGICGTSAWSLAKMQPENTYYRALSVNHDQLALKYIQQTIEQAHGLQDATIPAAIMTCLTGDTVSGRLDLWGLHLRGGFRCLLSALANTRTIDSALSSLCQQYLLSAAFARFGSVNEIRTLQNAIIDDYSYIQECHCISRAMVEVMLAINQLMALKHPSHVRIEQVRNQLIHSMPLLEEQPSQPIRYYLSHAYYCGIMVYFNRSILKVRDVELQELASIAIDHLERAQSASSAGYPGNPGRVLMWLLFTIGPECTTSDLRARLLAWCNSQMQVNVSNMNQFIGLLQKTWSLARLASPRQDDGTSVDEVKTQGQDREG